MLGGVVLVGWGIGWVGYVRNRVTGGRPVYWGGRYVGAVWGTEWGLVN